MNTEHTQGPWSLETIETSSGICHKIGPFPPSREGGRLRHACLYADYPSDHNPADQELLANARLIAAAPELLEALKTCLDQSWDGAIAAWVREKAAAAINKAEGEQ